MAALPWPLGHPGLREHPGLRVGIRADHDDLVAAQRRARGRRLHVSRVLCRAHDEHAKFGRDEFYGA